MPNTYFQFRQFIVHQDKTAMKVCTDACLFGAWVANRIQPGIALDIGTGTGLLSLMIAQSSRAVIDAVEIDENAFRQAQINFGNSPWSDRLRAIHSRIQDFSGAGYDLIISNPPFYKNDLRSGDKARNLALHGDALSLEELVGSVLRLLKPEGVFAVLLPFHRAEDMEILAARHGLVKLEKLLVKQTPSHAFFRVMFLYSKNTYHRPSTESEICIRDAAGNYTTTFANLLNEYYL